jgi:release factor glutamine methyltransferase
VKAPAAAALAAGAARLAAAGVPGAPGDARALLAHALGVNPGRLILALDGPLTDAAARAYEAALAARIRRQPVSQIIGRRLFWGRSFRVTPDVLDPRPETETLVAAALAVPFATVLDLGTGSGAILLSLLADRPAARGTGTDRSEAALAVARANADALGVAARARLVAGDWYAPVAGRFDLVVSNPPYIARAGLAALDPEVRDWEPAAALSPGEDALAAFRTIAAGAAAHLVPGGRLIVECGAGQGAAVAAIVAAAGLAGPAVGADLDGRDRIVTARAPC